jgi:hypothetical protein
MHPPAADYVGVSFVLGKKTSQLSGGVGISKDDPVQPPREHHFQLLGDGKPLWKSKTMTGFDTQEMFEVDVSAVEVLELRVYCEKPDATCMHAAWINPMLRLK